jgi:hypothetical protein
MNGDEEHVMMRRGARRCYMSVRDRPSHSRMFAKDGTIIPLKDDPPSDDNGRRGKRLLLLAIGGIAMYRYHRFKHMNSENKQVENEEEGKKLVPGGDSEKN